MLLYLVKYSRPDLANAVRELSKGAIAPTEGCWKELLRVLKFTLDTKNLGLKMALSGAADQEKWRVVCYSDSDWAGDSATRKSVTGYVLFVMGCPVMWKSRQQTSVGLSSSEAELYACVDAVKEVKFLTQLMESVGLEVEYPVSVQVDNTGAIFMSENLGVSQRTKHVDLRARYLLNQMVDERVVKVSFVKSEDNLSDGMTKNVNRNVYEKVSDSYVGPQDYMDHYPMPDRKGVGGSVPDSGRQTANMTHTSVDIEDSSKTSKNT